LGTKSRSSQVDRLDGRRLEGADGAPLLMQLHATGEIEVRMERVRTETFRQRLHGCETHYGPFPWCAGHAVAADAAGWASGSEKTCEVAGRREKDGDLRFGEGGLG
jgi:hypothetical protein